MPDSTETASRRILLCYDGSPESERALARAAMVARSLDARVDVISVADPIYRNPPYTGYADPREQETHSRLVEDARRKLADAGVRATGIERVGDVADVIAEEARAGGAELLVVGTRHRGALKRLL